MTREKKSFNDIARGLTATKPCALLETPEQMETANRERDILLGELVAVSIRYVAESPERTKIKKIKQDWHRLPPQFVKDVWPQAPDQYLQTSLKKWPPLPNWIVSDNLWPEVEESGIEVLPAAGDDPSSNPAFE